MQKKTTSLIIGLFAAGIIAIFAILFGFAIYKDQNIRIENPIVSNVTDSGAAFSWYSEEKLVAKVRIREVGGMWMDEVFYDDRDIEQNVATGEYDLKPVGAQKRNTHHISIRGLEPEKEYEVSVVGRLLNVDKDENGVALPGITTLSVNEDLVTPDPVYGSVLSSDLTKEPPNDGIVYFYLVNRGDFEIKSQLYSTVISETHSWAADLANIRDVSGNTFQKLDTTLIKIDVLTDEMSDSTSYTLVEYKPLPVIYLGDDVVEEGSASSTGLIGKVFASTADGCGASACEAGGACYGNGFLAVNNADTTKPFGTYVCESGEWVQVNGSSNPPTAATCEGGEVKSCDHSYDEPCNADGNLGSRKCHKVNSQNPCGLQDSSCPWTAASYCDRCIPTGGQVSAEASGILRKYAGQEAGGAPAATGAVGAPAGNNTAIINGAETVGNTPTLTLSGVANIVLAEGSGVCTYDHPGLGIEYDYKPGCEYFDPDTPTGVGDNVWEVTVNVISDGNNGCTISPSKVIRVNYDGVLNYLADYINEEYGMIRCRADEVVDNGNVDDETCIFQGLNYPVGCLYCSPENNGSVFRKTTAGNNRQCISPEATLSEILAVYPTYALEIGDYGGYPCIIGTHPEFQTACTAIRAGTSRFAVDESGREKVLGESDLPGTLMSPITAATDKLVTTESGDYVVYYGDNFEQPVSEFAVNLDGADRAEIRLFIDTNGNGKKDKDEPVLDDYTSLSLKKDSEVATYNLSAGWNLITMPLISSDGISTASELLDHFNNQGADIKHIAKYTDSGFEMYTKRENEQEFSNDYNIVPGQSYFVLNYTPVEAKIKGNKFDEPIPFRVRNGWNLVGVYTNEAPYTAEELVRDMNEAGIEADVVSKYEGGLYTSIVYEDSTLYGNDYNIFERSGYFIRVQNGGGSDVKFTPTPN
ncbi:hypothetical protein JW978_00455 [Candidatus Dojkabacteria bacterium]|nr:hypothetical protein [Candidatus Dojkabacteria bacterium]